MFVEMQQFFCGQTLFTFHETNGDVCGEVDRLLKWRTYATVSVRFVSMYNSLNCLQ